MEGREVIKGENGGMSWRRLGLLSVTYHFCWDAHGVELFLVVGAGLGAIVCDEDDLLPWKYADYHNDIYFPDKEKTHLYSSVALSSRQYPRTSGLRTIERLCSSSPSQL